MEQKIELSSEDSTETKPIKAFGYACFPKDVKVDVSKELMSAFINASLPYASVEVVDSFVEPNNRKGFVNRWEWKAMMKRCREEGVKLIVIPAIKMLSYYLVDALDKAKKVKEEFGIDIYFMLEDIHTGAEDVKMKIDFHCVLQQQIDTLEDKKKSFRKTFRETARRLGIGVFYGRMVYPDRQGSL